jgi:hypothetical protein
MKKFVQNDTSVILQHGWMIKESDQREETREGVIKEARKGLKGGERRMQGETMAEIGRDEGGIEVGIERGTSR